MDQHNHWVIQKLILDMVTPKSLAGRLLHDRSVVEVERILKDFHVRDFKHQAVLGAAGIFALFFALVVIITLNLY